MKEISAVVFSNVATFGKVRALSAGENERVFFDTVRSDSSGLFPIEETVPLRDYSESLLDGLKVFHNPYAANPLSRHLFRDKGVAQFSCNLETGVPVTYDMTGHLELRIASTFKERA